MTVIVAGVVRVGAGATPPPREKAMMIATAAPVNTMMTSAVRALTKAAGAESSSAPAGTTVCRGDAIGKAGFGGAAGLADDRAPACRWLPLAVVVRAGVCGIDRPQPPQYEPAPSAARPHPWQVRSEAKAGTGLAVALQRASDDRDPCAQHRGSRGRNC